MLVVTRYRAGGGVSDQGVGGVEDTDFLERARAALDALAARPGFRSGRIGRAADDPSYWIMAIEWENVGAYRRALSAYEEIQSIHPDFRMFSTCRTQVR